MRARYAILALAMLPALAPAQVIPAGATPEEVMRALGSPRSRSATKGREIWLYADHQAVFEHGRLTSLVALPGDGGNIAWQNRGVPVAAPSMALESSGRQPAGPAGSGVEGRGAAAGAMIVTREGGKLVLRSPERTSPPPLKQSRGMFVPLLVMLLLSSVGGAGAVLWYRKRRAATRREKTTPGATSRAAVAGAAVPAEPVVESESRAQFVPELKAPTLVDWELTPELLRTMEWKRFELLVQRYFSATGLQTKTHLVGADGGIDLYLYRGRSTRPISYVQCRTWGQRGVDGRQARELFSHLAEYRVPEGMILTTGTFAPDAEVFARQNRITLIGGGELIARFNRLPHMVRARILTDVTAGDFTTPSCPRCNVKLVVREKGRDGTLIWACRRFPQCRYTIKSQLELAVG